MQFGIIGLGKFGQAVAQELYSLGNQVIGMDIDEKKVEQVSPFLSASIILDATDKAALLELNIQDFDAILISIGENLESNLLCALNLKELKAKTLWAKAKNAAHYTLLQSLGVDHIVRPEHDMGILVGQAMNCPNVNHCIQLTNDRFLIDLQITFQASISVAMFRKRYPDIQITAIQRAEQLITPVDDHTEIHSHDHLLLIGKMDALSALTHELR